MTSAPSLEDIKLKREEVRLNRGTIKEGVNYQLVCPACAKPNSATVKACTGCGFELCEWDLQETSGTLPQTLPTNLF